MTITHQIAAAVFMLTLAAPASAQRPPAPPVPPGPPAPATVPAAPAAPTPPAPGVPPAAPAAPAPPAFPLEGGLAAFELDVAPHEFAGPDFELTVPEFEFDFDFEFDVPEFAFVAPEFNEEHIEAIARDARLRAEDVQARAAELQERAARFAQAAPRPAPSTRPAPMVFVDKETDGLYNQARAYIDRDQYERALDPLNRLISSRESRAPAAMYWKAYSLSKLARHGEALATLAEMRKQYPDSSWIREAGFLEVTIRQASGQGVSAGAQASDEEKLLALQGIMRSDPNTAIPVIEKTLAGNSSVRVKERALFVLSQSRAVRAREVITGVAKSASNPDLQIAAIRYMGRMSGPEVMQALEDIYRGTTDVDVKRAVLQALSQGRAIDKLGAIARVEKDAALRNAAVRQLGTANSVEAAEVLKSLYSSESSVDARRAVLQALGSNRNGAAALVALARMEKDPELRREIIRRLSVMQSPEAQRYLLELLN